jgi:hypothetical protein
LFLFILITTYLPVLPRISYACITSVTASLITAFILREISCSENIWANMVRWDIDKKKKKCSWKTWKKQTTSNTVTWTGGIILKLILK